MPNCPICAYFVEGKEYIEKFFSFFNKQEYKLYHCQNCDIQWWEPLKMIPEFYEKEGDESYMLLHLGLRERIDKNHEMFFKKIPIKRGRLLDVGCGDGIFLKEAEKIGFEVWGVDLDKRSIEVCKDKGLTNTYAMTLNDFVKLCKEKNIYFDIVTFFEVLEHQDDPLNFLKQINQLLHSQGYIAGSVPNRDSWCQVTLNRKIRVKVDNPPHHFLRFSKTSLVKILKILGIEKVEVFSTPLTISSASFVLQNFLIGEKMNKFLKKQILHCEFGGEGTAIFKEVSTWRKLIFKGLKYVRNFIFFLPSLYLVLFTEGFHLYFQAQTNKKKDV